MAASACFIINACRDFRSSAGDQGAFEGGGNAGESGRRENGEAGDLRVPGSIGRDGGAGGAGENAAGASPRPAGGARESGEGGGSAGGADEGGAGGAGEGGAGGEDTGPLSPITFEQLVLWLEAKESACQLDHDGRLIRWRDASPYANDALASSLGSSPRWADRVVNGHGAFAFEAEATAVEVPDAPSLQFGTADFAYLLVMRWDNSPKPAGRYPGSGAVLRKQQGVDPWRGVLLMANYPAIFAEVPAATRLAVQLELGGALALSYNDGFNDGVFRLNVVRRKGSDLSLRVNGAGQGGSYVAPNLDLSAPTSPLVLGGHAGQPLHGHIAEVVALRGSTSDADFVRLERFLLDRYGLR